MSKRIWVMIPLAAGALGTMLPVSASEGPLFQPATRSYGGVVAAESPEAAAAGLQILNKGGNAVDAAAATVFALNVGIPYDCGIGGGGYMVYRSAEGDVASLDFRETAPAAMQPDSLNGPGLNQSETGHLVVGVPGVLKGMQAMLTRYGTMSLAQVLAPATRLARQGVKVTPSFSALSAANAPRLRLYPAAADEYLVGGVAPYPAGSTVTYPALADTFDLIAKKRRRLL
jgi:gamma-glutamyltranspeptidase/glutathione hydrolase